MKRSMSNGPTRCSLELFQPKPGTLYGLDVTARVTGISRRTIMVYCRAGLVEPVIRPPHGIIEFTEEAIYTLRRIDYLHSVQGLDLIWIKTLFDLHNEVERLRAEVRFLRSL